MACHLSHFIKYSYGAQSILRAFNYNHLLLPNKLSKSPRNYSSISVESIQVPKYLQALIDQPIERTLSCINQEDISGSNSVTYLKAFRMQKQFKGIDAKSFVYDSRFNTLCDIFEKNILQVPPNQFLSGLRSLLELGLSSDDPCVISAEKRIIQNISEFSTFDIIVCLNFHQKFAATELQKKVILTLQKTICDQVNAITSASEVLMLCSFFHLFFEHQKLVIEEKIVELLPLLNVHELCKVLTSLSEKSMRNVKILNAVSFQIIQNSNAPDIKDTLGMFYSFKTLNFCDPILFSYLLKGVIPKIRAVEQPSIISGFLSTCGHLRWRSKDLLNVCTLWIESNFPSCRTRELVSYILATASLNYSTPRTKQTIRKIISHMSPSVIKDSAVLLDIVWSLAIHDIVPKDLLIHVLTPSFYRKLIDGSEFRTKSSNILKLLNLKGVLKLSYPEYLFSTNLYLEPIQLPENISIMNCRKHVVKVLSNFVPKETCLSVNHVHDMGIFIDAQFIMDQNFKPLPLKDFDYPGNLSGAKKHLPKGSNRYCLLIMFHKDYTMETHALTGVNVLATKLLNGTGHIVVEVPYTEFSQNTTELQQAKYLQQKIKNSTIV